VIQHCSASKQNQHSNDEEGPALRDVHCGDREQHKANSQNPQGDSPCLI
jgi:hypothetical protein